MKIPADSIAWLVDDNASVRKSMGALLEASGIASRAFASAAEFLANYNCMVPGCLIADYDMPGMTGLQLLESLRAAARPLPAIIITGRGDAALEQRVMAMGALKMLYKPVDGHELIELVETAILNGI